MLNPKLTVLINSKHIAGESNTSKTWNDENSMEILLDFLKNTWNFEIFYQDPGKLLEKQIISLYFWKTPGILWGFLLSVL